MNLKRKPSYSLYLNICSERHIHKYSKEINYLKSLCENNNISDELEKMMISILLIETYFRNLFFRIVEYILVVVLGISNLILGIPMKNYTVGVFQIGISYILNYDGFIVYEHSKYIRLLGFDMFKSIISSFNYKKNIEVGFYRVNNYYDKLKFSSDNRLIARRIGEKYNGRYEYGLLVEKINDELKIISNATN